MKCAVIGSGSSLLDFNLARIKDMDRIAINSSLKVLPCQYLVFLDAEFVETYTDELLKFKGDIYCSERAAAKITELDLPIEYTSFKTQYNAIATDWIDPIIGMMSGLAALNIALLLGYKEIYLIGYDLYPGHIFQRPNKAYSDDWTMNKIVRKFELFKDVDAKIYNCNPLSRIKTFPFQIP